MPSIRGLMTSFATAVTVYLLLLIAWDRFSAVPHNHAEMSISSSGAGGGRRNNIEAEVPILGNPVFIHNDGRSRNFFKQHGVLIFGEFAELLRLYRSLLGSEAETDANFRLRFRNDSMFDEPRPRHWIRKLLNVRDATSKSYPCGPPGLTDSPSQNDRPSPLVPPQLLPLFLLNGTVPLVYRYSDDRPISAPPRREGSNNNNQSRHTVRDSCGHYRHLVSPATIFYVQRFLQGNSLPYVAPAAEPNSLAPLLEQLKHFTAFSKNRHAVVFGSARPGVPLLEMALLNISEAATVASVDFWPSTFTSSSLGAADDAKLLRDIHRRVHYMSVTEFWWNANAKSHRQKNLHHPPHQETTIRSRSSDDAVTKYDIALVIGTAEHDGLGRFGDPIDPFGDLKLMNEIWSLLRPGGLLFLSVPIGNDCLVFNRGRIYGIRRFRALIAGWSVVTAVGVDRDTWHSNDLCQHDDTLKESIGSHESSYPAQRVGAEEEAEAAHPHSSSRGMPLFVLRRTKPPIAELEWRRIPGLSRRNIPHY